MLPSKPTVVTPKNFDQLFSDEALIAEFATAAEEEEYEKLDSFLIHLIQTVVTRHFGSGESNQPHVGEDWWPNHTRYIDTNTAQFKVGFLSDLHQLLTDDYENYRFQICVYEDMMEGASYVGSMALYSDRFVIEENLNKALNQQTEEV